MTTQTTHKNTAQQVHQYGHILMLSAWGFVIVFSSLLSSTSAIFWTSGWARSPISCSVCSSWQS